MIADTLEQATPEPELTDDRPLSILLVDDDENQVEVLAHRLRHQGFLTLAAHDGGTALSMALAERPQLIVLDLQLPDMNGFEICEKLGDESATCAIPVILLSGSDRADIVRRARAAGCQFYVRKPYDPNALLILIQKAIEEAREL